jgi:hypothetical protein
MKSKLALSFFALSTLAVLPATGFAASSTQDNGSYAKQDRDRDDDRGKVREMTGCLQKDGNEYELVADNGSTWELKSDKAELSDHVGHTIRVTGTVDHKKMHDAKEKTQGAVDRENREHGHLTVTDIKMVSRSCTR